MKRLFCVAFMIVFFAMAMYHLHDIQQCTVVWNGNANMPESFTSRQIVAEVWAAAFYIEEQVWIACIWLFCYIKLG